MFQTVLSLQTYIEQEIPDTSHMFLDKLILMAMSNQKYLSFSRITAQCTFNLWHVMLLPGNDAIA